MHLRMEGLHPSVTDLRETGDLAYAYGLYPVVLEKFLGPACGDDFPAVGLQSLYEIDKSGLVAYTYECAFFHISSCIISD